MALYLLTYDLNKTKNYPKLYDELKRLDSHRALESVWLCELNNTPKEVLEHFKKYIDNDDSLMIVKINKNDIQRLRTKIGTSEWLDKAA